jgi:hypothetical protein
MRCLFKRKIFRLLRLCNVEIFAVLSDTAFGMHEIDPYNTGISNMEYALNFSRCLFMRATAMSRAESQRLSYLLQSHIIVNAYFVGDWQSETREGLWHVDMINRLGCSPGTSQMKT